MLLAADDRSGIANRFPYVIESRLVRLLRTPRRHETSHQHILTDAILVQLGTKTRALASMSTNTNYLPTRPTGRYATA